MGRAYVDANKTLPLTAALIPFGQVYHIDEDTFCMVHLDQARPRSSKLSPGT